jgi:prevent-host-death family protein
MEKHLISLTELGRSTGSVVEQISADGRPRLITRRGEPIAVLLDLGTFERIENDLELLRRLALGEVESASGRGHPMAEVLADCDLLLEEN